MSDQEIKTNLCDYDPENPNSNLDAYEDEDLPQPRTEGCCCDNCFYGRDKLAIQLFEAKRERDKAREALRQWKTLCLWGGTPEHIHDFIKGQQTRIHEAQDIEKTCEQLERERDEAREDLKNHTASTIHSCHDQCQKPMCVLRRERDEAREALMKIEDLFIDGTDIYADRENMGLIARAALEESK